MVQKKYSWSSPISVIPGIGPKRARALQQSGIHTVGQLLEWFPRRYIDRSVTTEIRNLQEGQTATVAGTILRAVKAKGRKPRFFIMINIK